MRLTPAEIEAIVRAVHEVFGETARVRVFGSRVRDDLKGGDLDLFAPALDDLRTDILLHERGRPSTPIERIALRDGVLL